MIQSLTSLKQVTFCGEEIEVWVCGPDFKQVSLLAVHYGPDVATPISIDTKVKSQREIADQLWNFVSDEW